MPPGRLGGSAERPALFFADAAEFAAWLAENHATAPDLWMGLYKRHVPDPGLRWEDAVVEALRYGWIDSKVERIDEDAIRQRWTPRRPTSKWSRINIETVERLIAEGRMEPAGLAAFHSRKVEDAGYTHEHDGELTLPEDYAALMAANPAATAFWAETTPSYRKICTVWVRGAKQPATNDKRMRQLIEDHAAGRMIPSQRYGEVPKWVARAAAAARAASD
ncbi:MAG: YdeI/OmpD-associated family protein [Marmoricola sp.]